MTPQIFFGPLVKNILYNIATRRRSPTLHWSENSGLCGVICLAYTEFPKCFVWGITMAVGFHCASSENTARYRGGIRRTGLPSSSNNCTQGFLDSIKQRYNKKNHDCVQLRKHLRAQTAFPYEVPLAGVESSINLILTHSVKFQI